MSDCVKVVFVLAVPCWLLGALVETPEGSPIMLPLSALQLVCPFMAALILSYREEGSGGIRSLLARVLSSRGITPIWYVPIILVMPTIYLLAYDRHRLLKLARGLLCFRRDHRLAVS